MIDYLLWLASHPLPAFLIVFLQFILFAKLHHKAHNKYLHWILAIIFTPQNWIVNATVISVIGLEFPKWRDKEFSTTGRLTRWKTLDPAKSNLCLWRFRFATQLCNILNKYDSGHC